MITETIDLQSTIPPHTAAKLADLRRTAETLDYLVRNGVMEAGVACVLSQMSKSIMADVGALELEMWRAKQPAELEQLKQERPKHIH
jgi:hypothetical protein